MVFTAVLFFRGEFLDDLWHELQWTLARGRWTIGRNGLLRAPFRVYRRCKSAIAGLLPTGRGYPHLLRVRKVRYGERAVAVAGRSLVSPRVTSSTSELKTAQRRALLALESDPGTSLTRSEYERLTGVGRSQAAYDLAELVSAGVLVRVGGGRTTRYMRAHEPAGKRRWTPDRIRRELDAFCAERSVWPTATEFKAAGHGDLYVAASRYGGVAYWAKELGLARAERSRTFPAAARAPFRSRIAWAGAGAFAALLLAAAAATAIFATYDFGSSRGAAPRASSPRAEGIVGGWFNPLRLTTPVRDRAPRAKEQTTKGSSRVRRRAPEHTTFVSSSPDTESVQTGSSVTKTLTAAVARSNGPAPLPAPSVGASAPSPLRAPQR